MARSGRVGGEFGEQALAVALADAGGPGQASTGRRLAGLDVRLIGGSHTSPCAIRYALIRTDREAACLELPTTDK